MCFLGWHHASCPRGWRASGNYHHTIDAHLLLYTLADLPGRKLFEVARGCGAAILSERIEPIITEPQQPRLNSIMRPSWFTPEVSTTVKNIISTSASNVVTNDMSESVAKALLGKYMTRMSACQ